MRKRVFFTMESQCREAKKEGNFLPNISICISKSSSEAENEQKRQEREKGERGKREMRRRGKRERERENNEWMFGTNTSIREPKKGWPPSPLFLRILSILVHVVEYRVPCGGFHVCPIILIEAAARARVVVLYLKSFSYFEVINKFVFAFVAHSGNDGWVFPVDSCFACFFVLSDARVCPFLFFHCFAMFIHASVNAPAGLAYVFAFRVACAVYFVDPFFAGFRGVGFVFCAK